MSTTRQSHYLPRFYLRGFEGQEGLWVYGRNRGRRRSSAEKEARQRDLYAYREADGRLETAFEDWLGEIESRVAPLVSRIQARGFQPSDEEKQHLFWFVATVFVRVPEAFRNSREVIGPAVERLIAAKAQDLEVFIDFLREDMPWLPADTDFEKLRREALDPELLRATRTPQMELLGMAEAAAQGVEAMSTFNIQYVHANSVDKWITTDDPIMTMFKGNNREGVGVGFTTPGVKVLVPLSSKVALLLGRDVIPADGDANGFVVRGLNRLAMQCANRFVYASEPSDLLQKAVDRHIGTYVRGQNVHLPLWDGKFI